MVLERERARRGIERHKGAYLDGPGGKKETEMADTASVTMFSTTWCGYCRRLKRQMTDAGIDFREVDLDDDPSHDARIIATTGGYRTVPTLEVNGRLLVNPTLGEVEAAIGQN